MKRHAEEVLRSVLARVAAAPGELADCLEQRAEALIAFTSERRIVAANEAAERFFGYGRRELDTSSVDVLVPTRLRQPDARPPLATPDLMSVELPGLRKDGTEVPIVWILGSAPAPSGPIFVMVLLHREQASVVLRTSESALAAADRIRKRSTGEGSREHGETPVEALIASMDWSTSPIGAAETWPTSLRTVLRLMLSSRYAMWMGWGPELTFFCNDSYRHQTLGAKYPWAIGRPAREVWAEIWDVIGPRIEHVLATGEATWDEGLLLFLERSGYPEETYHSFSYSAAPADEKGRTGGLFCVVVEETERVIGERRIAFLGRFAALLSQVKSKEEVCAALEECLKAENLDVPFALTYLFDGEAKVARRFSASGFEADDDVAPDTIRLDVDAPWPLASSSSGSGPRVVDLDPGRSWPRGPWKLAPNKAVMLPIAGSTGESKPVGVLIAGLNPHRPYDDKYREFLALFVGQLAAGLSTAGAYEAEKKRAEALAELDRAKTTFFSNVSHEFRTPLTLMLAPIEEMRSGVFGDPEERERLELLHRNALRLLKLVNTLLDFSRIEAGRVAAVYEPTDLAALTSDLASTFRSAMERAGLDFHVETPGLREPVYVDRDMWEKIVLNLLSNAFKFTFEGSISVRLRDVEGFVELQVSDTGTGIAATELPRLFERFHRIEGARSRSHEGTGIGLALVHELVRMHGGQIDVQSQEGVGTTFRVSIPRGSAHLPAERIRAERRLQSSATSASAYVEEAMRWVSPSERAASEEGKEQRAGASLPRARIVVADDNADMRDYVSRLLREHWEVEAVTDGRAALDAIRQNQPDLVLSDVMMPGLDGFALLRALREDASLRETPIILLSARAGEEAVSEGLAAGADDYLVKPFTARELLVRVAARLAAASNARALREQRSNLFRTFMQAPFPIVIFRGKEHVIEAINNATLDIWGRGPDIIGKPLLDALPELRAQQFPKLLDQVYASGKPYVGREELARLARGRGGALEDVFFNYVYAPILDTAGGTEGIMVCAFDTTEQVLARQRIEALRQVAEQASRAKDEFLSTLSHELRTPLNAIVGWSALLKRGSVAPEQVAKVVDTIDRNARVQARLIEDLLELSRIEQGKLVLSVGPLEMVRVVEAAIDTCTPAADAKGVRIQRVLDSHATIVGDPERLQQIVWNLLSNAIKFTPRGGRVQVRLRREHSYVELVISDTGQGIEPTFLPHVFDRFRQADGSSTRRTGGLGLGLAIVRSLVELHGGTVQAESEGANRGATFTVRLPTAPLRADRAAPSTGGPVSREVPAGVPAPAMFTCPPELRGLRVLVVDDEPETRALLEYVLEQCDAVVTTAGSASEALQTLKDGGFDVLVSDVGMPEEDGHSLMRKVRALPGEYSTIPALALTAYARSEDRAAAFMAGFDVHLAKPIDPSELLIVVARMVSRQRIGASAKGGGPSAQPQ